MVLSWENLGSSFGPFDVGPVGPWKVKEVGELEEDEGEPAEEGTSCILNHACSLAKYTAKLSSIRPEKLVVRFSR